MTFALHQGMIIVGLPNTYKELMAMDSDKVMGGSFYGATAVVGDGSKPIT